MTLIERIYYYSKWFLQRVFRGYSDYDFMDFNEFICKKIRRYLKKWVEHERCGYPASLESFEEWNKILDEIVWVIEENANGFKGEQEIFDRNEDKGFSEFRPEVEAYWKRHDKAMELFGKYLPAMWD